MPALRRRPGWQLLPDGQVVGSDRSLRAGNPLGLAGPLAPRIDAQRIAAAGHFTDRAATGGSTLNPQVQAATQASSTAVLGNVFDADSGALRLWGQRFAGLLARFSPP